MVLSYLWIGFFLITFVIACSRLIMGDAMIFKVLIDGVFESAKTGVELSLGLIGIMSLFLGFMSVGERAGAINFLSRIVGPFLQKLFPEVPRNHPAMGHMMMNFSANLLGLDNAATPFGLKAMQSLQELNEKKDTASNAQIMFMVLHASGLVIIPVSIIAMRVSVHSKNATEVFIPCVIGTFVATMVAMSITALKQKFSRSQWTTIALFGGSISVLLGFFAWFMRHMLSNSGAVTFSNVVSNGLIFLIFVVFILGGLYKRINIFESFVEGAKQGFEVAVRIIPYLVGMLVAIGLLRNSGAFDYAMNGLRWFFTMLGMNTDFVPSIPTALMKPFSGNGSRGLMVEAMNQYGPDSFVGRLVCVIQGSADTTFYIVAVYFGSVGIKNTRYAVPAALLADLAGIITAIIVTYNWPWS